MNNVETKPGSRAADLVGVGIRWLLGALFVYMGLQKAFHPETFLKQVHQYQVIDSPFLLNTVASTLPWFETVCGALLILGIAVRGVALNVLLMLVPFTILVLRRALQISATEHIGFTQVKFDCGCGTGEIFIWKKMLENSGLMLLAIGLLCGYGKRMSLKYTFLRERSGQAADAPSPAKSLVPHP
jgi:uncharacterized membrane protein YphA (DoxX/SURF4 family)